MIAVDQTPKLTSLNLVYTTKPHSFLTTSMFINGCANLRQRKPKGQSRMDITEKLATLGTKEKGGRQQNKKHRTEN